MSKLDTLIDTVIQTHKQRYAQDSSQLAPMVMLARGGIIEQLLVMGFSSETAKRREIAKVKQLVRMHGYTETVFSSEAWMLDLPIGEEINVRPSESERRIEVLIIEGRSANTALTVTLKINRNWNGDYTGFEEVHRSGKADTMSKFDFFS